MRGSASLAETSWFTWSAWVKWWSAWGEASRIAWTGPPRSEGSGRVDGPKGNLSVILDALSRSRGALSPAGP